MPADGAFGVLCIIMTVFIKTSAGITPDELILLIIILLVVQTTCTVYVIL